MHGNKVFGFTLKPKKVSFFLKLNWSKSKNETLQWRKNEKKCHCLKTVQTRNVGTEARCGNVERSSNPGVSLCLLGDVHTEGGGKGGGAKYCIEQCSSEQKEKNRVPMQMNLNLRLVTTKK